MKRDVPFYSNTPDNTHCFQAALRMVLKYFTPEQEYSWEELENITAKEEGKWTWPIAAMIWLSKNGYEVRDIELFDYLEFAERGKEYMAEKFGSDVAEAQDKNTNLAQEQKFAGELYDSVSVEQRIPAIKDITNLLDEGFLLICAINSAALKGKEGYLPHSVVVIGYEENALIFHNPGIPPVEQETVTFEEFERAWAYPDGEAKNILAVRAR